MKKIEIIWNQLLFDVLEKRQTRFQLQHLAQQLSCSLSTVHHSLKPLKRMGAVEVGGKGGEIVDAEKILMNWANYRKLETDIQGEIKLGLSVISVERSLPPGSILGAYSAVRHWYKEAPADYETVYFYHQNPALIKTRFSGEEGSLTKVVYLKLEKNLQTRAETTSLGHTFVDLWNIKEWMAKDFIARVKEEVDGLLSR